MPQPVRAWPGEESVNQKSIEVSRHGSSSSSAHGNMSDMSSSGSAQFEDCPKCRQKVEPGLIVSR